MDGFLCVDKPQGASSRDVVNQVQRLTRPAKVGHAGTLDPLATGVLVVAVGAATRLVQYVQRLPKYYRGTFLLGRTSDTDDVTGNVTSGPVDRVPSSDEVQQVCRGFVGKISQRPPAFSAIKVKGRRAYQLARSGQQVELQARSVEIYSIDVNEYDFPTLEVTVVCGSGTYIRSLGRDIGEALGCGAAMSRLRRTAVGPFAIERGTCLSALSSEQLVRDNLWPLAAAVEELPRVELTDQQRRAVGYGQRLAITHHAADEVVALDTADQLVAILIRMPDGRYRPAINFTGS